jgi:hypothetical protein
MWPRKNLQVPADRAHRGTTPPPAFPGHGLGGPPCHHRPLTRSRPGSSGIFSPSSSIYRVNNNIGCADVVFRPGYESPNQPPRRASHVPSILALMRRWAPRTRLGRYTGSRTGRAPGRCTSQTLFPGGNVNSGRQSCVSRWHRPSPVRARYYPQETGQPCWAAPLTGSAWSGAVVISQAKHGEPPRH